MPTLAQVFPVLFLGQLVDSQFLAGRIRREIADHPESDRAVARGYMTITAFATTLAFLIAEGAALAGIACGPTTFTVGLVLGAGLVQSLDLAFGVLLHGVDRPAAVTRMLRTRLHQQTLP